MLTEFFIIYIIISAWPNDQHRRNKNQLTEALISMLSSLVVSQNQTLLFVVAAEGSSCF
jgi:hypothetical protein